ncbi:hypothetical protein [Actinoplanes regularis]|uniref:DUF3592 domain-containing protein n=1 Tax=Actinoplanes regularis TaxID=52697 RepID=A0A238WEC2_9ACTN|nr:hypothetical protein [Actinoplanes regularis]GIE84992.1 hypothetical protein Are01nite_14720 [Actinoplanes regularis]SNR44623.1 hypothetical protein SAMN06264365_102435 [Actinoplanes regularis]
MKYDRIRGLAIMIACLGFLGLFNAGADLYREAELALGSSEVTASVLQVATDVNGEVQYQVSFPWEHQEREAWTHWMPDGTRPGSQLSVLVAVGDPDVVTGTGTGSQRLRHYLLRTTLFALLITGVVLFWRWIKRREAAAETRRRQVRPTVARTRTSRSRRRSHRKR